MTAILKQAIPTWVAEGGVGSGVMVTAETKSWEMSKELVAVETGRLVH